MTRIKFNSGEKYSHFRIVFKAIYHYISTFYNFLSIFISIVFGMFIANTNVHTHNGLRP